MKTKRTGNNPALLLLLVIVLSTIFRNKPLYFRCRSCYVCCTYSPETFQNIRLQIQWESDIVFAQAFYLLRIFTFFCHALSPPKYRVPILRLLMSGTHKKANRKIDEIPHKCSLQQKANKAAS